MDIDHTSKQPTNNPNASTTIHTSSCSLQLLSLTLQTTVETLLLDSVLPTLPLHFSIYRQKSMSQQWFITFIVPAPPAHFTCHNWQTTVPSPPPPPKKKAWIPRLQLMTCYPCSHQRHMTMNIHSHLKGFRPEWCISTIYHASDTPFWSGTLDIIVQIHHFGQRPLILYCFQVVDSKMTIVFTN